MKNKERELFPTRRDFLELGIAGSMGMFGLVNSLSCGGKNGLEGKRPNILFIMSDDHAYQAISAYGSVLNQTPNIDRLAREGMLFKNCFVTNSICAPSRATILTGKYSHENGLFNNYNVFDGSQETLPKLLRSAGYQTALIGKWHLKSDPTGFDYWDILPGQGIYYNPVFMTPEGEKTHTGYATELITEKTLDWLRSGRDAAKPFFLMCHHKAPHRAWDPAPQYLTKYNDVTFPEPPTLFDDYSHRASPAAKQEMEIDRHMRMERDLKMGFVPENLTPEQEKAWRAAYEPKYRDLKKRNLAGKDLVRWKYQRYLEDYLACIASVDDSVGKVLDYLDAAGLAENTIVVYTSDQGFYLGEHGWFDKRWIYEESLKTPLLIRWKEKIRPGSVDEHMVMNLDIPETFLDAAGAAVPEEMQGRSMLPILGGSPPSDWRQSMYYHYYEDGEHAVPRHYGVRTKRYKLAHFYQSDEWELFDLEKDPHELTSVYGDPAYAPIKEKLKAELVRLRKELNVPDPDPEEKLRPAQ